MLGSDTFSTQPVGFGPDRIRNRLEKPLPVDIGIGNVTSSWQKCSTGILVSVLDCVRIQEKMRQIIMDVDAQCLLMEEGGIELKQLECRTAPPVAVGLDCLAPCMDVIRVLG